MNQSGKPTRRDVLRTSAIAGTSAFLGGMGGVSSAQTLAVTANVSSKGVAARDKSGNLSPWTFERRPLGDNDVRIEIKYCGICHSDIHQMRGHWAPQQYPQVPGHEIAGVVSAVGD